MRVGRETESGAGSGGAGVGCNQPQARVGPRRSGIEAWTFPNVVMPGGGAFPDERASPDGVTENGEAIRGIGGVGASQILIAVRDAVAVQIAGAVHGAEVACPGEFVGI